MIFNITALLEKLIFVKSFTLCIPCDQRNATNRQSNKLTKDDRKLRYKVYEEVNMKLKSTSGKSTFLR